MSILLQAVRIGDLGISAIPLEVLTETGLELKTANPFKPSFTMELANGGYVYPPTSEQHRLASDVRFASELNLQSGQTQSCGGATWRM